MVLGIPLKSDSFTPYQEIPCFCTQTFSIMFINISYAQPVNCSSHASYFSDSLLILSFHTCLGLFLDKRICYSVFCVTHHITFPISAEISKLQFTNAENPFKNYRKLLDPEELWSCCMISIFTLSLKLFTGITKHRTHFQKQTRQKKWEKLHFTSRHDFAPSKKTL
jgi:hypothetical protein